MKKSFLLVAMALCFAYAANAQKTEKVETYQSTQARALDAEANAYVKPLIVDLKVISRTRIRYKLDLTLDEVAAFRGNEKDIRAYGVFRACKDNDCDVIVGVTFNLKGDNSTGYQLEVVGYPANYDNWRTASQEDFEWIRQDKVLPTGEEEKVKAVVKR